MDDNVDLTGSSCTNAGDDSIDGDDGVDAESVFLEFAEAFDVRSISFRDGEHNVIDGDQTIRFNAGFAGGEPSLIVALMRPDQVFTIEEILALAASGALDNVTALWFGFGGSNATEFYVEAISDVPLPGALPLLISGIAGLGFASRRRKTAK